MCCRRSSKKMYGPPRDCKVKEKEVQSAKMYLACLWSRAPGHDEDTRAFVLLSWFGCWRAAFLTQDAEAPI